jgi:hypothetical protein
MSGGGDLKRNRSKIQKAVDDIEPKTSHSLVFSPGLKKNKSTQGSDESYVDESALMFKSTELPIEEAWENLIANLSKIPGYKVETKDGITTLSKNDEPVCSFSKSITKPKTQNDQPDLGVITFNFVSVQKDPQHHEAVFKSIAALNCSFIVEQCGSKEAAKDLIERFSPQKLTFSYGDNAIPLSMKPIIEAYIKDYNTSHPEVKGEKSSPKDYSL